ncbi:uncharacterized protein LOC107762901 [Nicotiana tabacum]|uniref:Uncharacterized protein LOC107762901 n=1 Tax=Nicotiana tabacum TaxID=4097 RepID=A0A1S3XAJ2_TOBAC|nr:uncharacterized protein LOC104099281 [Nicotiana tomentosiformis]XP_009604518.1 uncharacterized protein LOC104099281 [Nicotiana tomentosiformis]XP_016436783.1 PREDICTED: uncharacterized protein LOC107762901 isoform X2 [Nicotiana tabacum]
MLGKSFASPLLTFNSASCFSSLCCDSGSTAANNLVGYVNCSNNITSNVTKGSWTSGYYLSKKWKLHSTATDNIVLTEEEKKTWNDSRQALSAFKFSPEEEDKILGKAFGQIHSPYWYEERKKEVPRLEVVNEILDYLRSLSLTDDDLTKLLKKFPEVLGCSLEDEMKNNVEILAKQWGIEGKTLTKVLLRNPKVLGYNVDCKGDCVAKCTRCWARF